MFARIIVAVDGYDGGRDALALARTLADESAHLVLVTAFPHDEQASRGSLAGFEQLIREDTDKALLESAGDDSRCEVRAVADSSPGRALHDEATREEADLIVVGSCHHGPVGRVLIGDVSRATLHGAACPVAVAPRGYRDRDPRSIKTIGVGFNGTDESRDALAFGAELAESFSAKLRLLTALSPPPATGVAHMAAYNWSEIGAAGRLAAEQTIAAAAAELAVPVETETVVERAALALEHLSEHVDVVVAGSRGWGAARRVVLGSTTDHLAHHAHCPVVVVPATVTAHVELPLTAPPILA
jgi:nucleotide-binding universal stress UspA family protein